MEKGLCINNQTSQTAGACSCFSSSVQFLLQSAVFRYIMSFQSCQFARTQVFSSLRKRILCCQFPITCTILNRPRKTIEGKLEFLKAKIFVRERHEHCAVTRMTKYLPLLGLTARILSGCQFKTEKN